MQLTAVATHRTNSAPAEFARALHDVDLVRDEVLAGRFDQLPTIDSAVGHVTAGFALLAPDASFDGVRQAAQGALRELAGARYHVDNLDRGTSDVTMHQHLAVEWLGVARGYLRDIAATLA